MGEEFPQYSASSTIEDKILCVWLHGMNIH